MTVELAEYQNMDSELPPPLHRRRRIVISLPGDGVKHQHRDDTSVKIVTLGWEC
jgi:hypothetical protein